MYNSIKPDVLYNTDMEQNIIFRYNKWQMDSMNRMYSSIGYISFDPINLIYFRPPILMIGLNFLNYFALNIKYNNKQELNLYISRLIFSRFTDGIQGYFKVVAYSAGFGVGTGVCMPESKSDVLKHPIFFNIYGDILISLPIRKISNINNLINFALLVRLELCNSTKQFLSVSLGIQAIKNNNLVDNNN